MIELQSYFVSMYMYYETLCHKNTIKSLE